MSEPITDRVREFRKNPTPSEKIIWEVLRNRKLNGKKFRRQHPIKITYQDEIRYFIADFYYHEKKLILEIDGKIHENQKEYDEYWTFLINQLGIKVFRLRNEDLIDITTAITKIKALL